MEATQKPTTSPTTTAVNGGPSPSGKIKSLLSSWEERASGSIGAPADVARLAVSPRGFYKKKIAMAAVTTTKAELTQQQQHQHQQDGSFVEKRKSTRQTMEDLSVFVSPRQIQKKFVVKPKQQSSSSSSPSALEPHKEEPPHETPVEVVTPTTKKMTLRAFPFPPPSQQEATPVSTKKEEVPKIGSIRERMKAFEHKRDEESNNNSTGADGQSPTWMSQSLRGKRGSALGQFTPKHTAKGDVISRRKKEGEETQQQGKEHLPTINLLRQDTEDEKKAPNDETPKERNEEEFQEFEPPVDMAPTVPLVAEEMVTPIAVPDDKSMEDEVMSAVNPVEEEVVAPIAVPDEKPIEQELPAITLLHERTDEEEKFVSSAIPEGHFEQPHSNSEELLKQKMSAVKSIDEDLVPVKTTDEVPTSPAKEAGKIDRDTLVLEEIRKMIRDTEDNELEDDMDEEVKEVLENAALQSPAYTKRWYDALSDSWIHCPSLATIVMDFSLIEAAEELYGEELPMLYTVSLRAVASEVMSGEEELPEYVYRLAS